jgi:alpha-L-rhamnosidase
VLDPGQTDYDQRGLYLTYDITAFLKSGENVAGVLLGDGWYSQTVGFNGNLSYGKPGVICQIEISYQDGKSQSIFTDSSWRSTASPILKNNIYAGEVYDARREKNGWCLSDFDFSGWDSCKVVNPLTPILQPQLLLAIKKIKTIKPIHLSNPKSGVWVFDFGQNFAGWVRLKVEAPSGTPIMLRYGEYQESTGMVNFNSTGHWATGAIQSDMYICNGRGVEVWEPRFTYHGFRYVELTGYPDTPSLDMLQGVVVRTSVKKAGHFECSDVTLNRIHDTVLWSYESNLHSIPTDCPHRERCGWLGDAHVTVEASIYNYDMFHFWRKYVGDIQTNSNNFPDKIPTAIAPGKRHGNRTPDWGVATIIIPWFHYLYYNDKRMLEDHYEYMTAFMDYQMAISENWIIKDGLGDWCDPVAFPGAERTGGRGRPQNTPPVLTSTAYFAFSAKIMHRVAVLLGKDQDSEFYQVLNQHIKTAFNKRFYTNANFDYGSQTANSFALYMGLVPDGDEEKVASSLAANVSDKWNGHYSTGSHGQTRLYWALQKYGYEELAFNIFHKRGYPSFNYLFSLGGTTLWERMGEFKPDQVAPKRSLNHPFHGGFDYWFYSGVGGIRIDPEHPGFKHFFVSPSLYKQLYWANVLYKSPYGEIKSFWKNEKDELDWQVEIPVNSTATVSLPSGRINNITVNGRPIEKENNIQILNHSNDQTKILVESGNYQFFCPLE